MKKIFAVAFGAALCCSQAFAFDVSPTQINTGKKAIKKVLGKDITLVDSSSETARTVEDILSVSGNVRRGDTRGETLYTVSDNHIKFKSIGERFLGEPLENIRTVSSEEFFSFDCHF